MDTFSTIDILVYPSMKPMSNRRWLTKPIAIIIVHKSGSFRKADSEEYGRKWPMTKITEKWPMREFSEVTNGWPRKWPLYIFKSDWLLSNIIYLDITTWKSDRPLSIEHRPLTNRTLFAIQCICMVSKYTCICFIYSTSLKQMQSNV